MRHLPSERLQIRRSPACVERVRERAGWRLGARADRGSMRGVAAWRELGPGALSPPPLCPLSDNGSRAPLGRGAHAAARSGVAGRRRRFDSRRGAAEARTRTLRALSARFRAPTPEHVRSKAETHAEQRNRGTPVYAGPLLYALRERRPEKHPASQEHHGEARGARGQQGQHHPEFPSRRWELLFHQSITGATNLLISSCCTVPYVLTISYFSWHNSTIISFSVCNYYGVMQRREPIPTFQKWCLLLLRRQKCILTATSLKRSFIFPDRMHICVLVPGVCPESGHYTIISWERHGFLRQWHKAFSTNLFASALYFSVISISLCISLLILNCLYWFDQLVVNHLTCNFLGTWYFFCYTVYVWHMISISQSVP